MVLELVHHRAILQASDILHEPLDARGGDLHDLLGVQPREALPHVHAVELPDEPLAGILSAEVDKAIPYVALVLEVDGQVHEVELPVKLQAQLLDQHFPRILVGNIPEHDRGVRLIARRALVRNRRDLLLLGLSSGLALGLSLAPGRGPVLLPSLRLALAALSSSLLLAGIIPSPVVLPPVLLVLPGAVVPVPVLPVLPLAVPLLVPAPLLRLFRRLGAARLLRLLGLSGLAGLLLLSKLLDLRQVLLHLVPVLLLQLLLRRLLGLGRRHLFLGRHLRGAAKLLLHLRGHHVLPVHGHLAPVGHEQALHEVLRTHLRAHEGHPLHEAAVHGHLIVVDLPLAIVGWWQTHLWHVAIAIEVLSLWREGGMQEGRGRRRHNVRGLIPHVGRHLCHGLPVGRGPLSRLQEVCGRVSLRLGGFFQHLKVHLVDGHRLASLVNGLEQGRRVGRLRRHHQRRLPQVVAIAAAAPLPEGRFLLHWRELQEGVLHFAGGIRAVHWVCRRLAR
mmetsp:Transcript_128202/g.304403  ORF Transcript_128202/g.304403 Transcript_128202/m.304403 type:complete len:503 (+) Transcript_128202:287-1795(+)